jgi:membrane protein
MRRWIDGIIAAVRRGRRFATYDVWHIGRPGEDVPSGFIIKQIRVAILLISNLLRGTMMLRASALTFATILAIVPSLAIMFYVIQTFGLDEAIFDATKNQVEGFVDRAAEFVRPESLPEEDAGETGVDAVMRDGAFQIEAVVEGDGEGVGENADASETPGVGEGLPDAQPQPSNEAAADAPGAAAPRATPETNKTLQRLLREMLFPESAESDGGYIDPVQELFDMSSRLADDATNDPSGLLVAGVILFLTTVLGLMRNIEKSFNHIWGVRRTRSWFRMVGDYMLITMLLPFVAALVMGVTAALQTETVQEQLGPLAAVVRGSQYVVIGFVFTALYFVVPNTRVRLMNAALGGLVAGTIWLLMSWGFVHFQFGLARYSVVYSTFAQFPIMLMWIYLSWIVLLFGAELTFAYQNEKTFAMERFAEEASFAYREALALRAMLDVAQRFDNGEPGFAPAPAAKRLNVPTRLLNDVMEDLEQAGLVIACATEPVTYQPSRALTKIAIRDVVRAMREVGRDPSLLREDEQVAALLDEVYGEHLGHQTMTLAELVERFPPAGKTNEAEDAPGSAPRTISFQPRKSKRKPNG